MSHTQIEQAKIRGQQLTFEAQLLDSDLVFRSIGFTNFLSTWLIRQVDPKKSHPNPTVAYVPVFSFGEIYHLCRNFRLPLPKEVPMAFRVLPEYIVEDIVEYLVFVTQCVNSAFMAGCNALSTCLLNRSSPDKFELAGKVELMTFVLTFLNCTWYIKNSFLKSKINDVSWPSLVLI